MHELPLAHQCIIHWSCSTLPTDQLKAGSWATQGWKYSWVMPNSLGGCCQLRPWHLACRPHLASFADKKSRAAIAGCVRKHWLQHLICGVHMCSYPLTWLDCGGVRPPLRGIAVVLLNEARMPFLFQMHHRNEFCKQNIQSESRVKEISAPPSG